MERITDNQRIAYRAFTVNDHGRLSGIPEIIEAGSDQDATQLAQRLAERRAIELWEGARLVARVMPTAGVGRHFENPVATIG